MLWLEQLEEEPRRCQALSLTLRPISTALRTDDSGRQRLWYQGRERYFDIFFEMKEQRLVWAQFSLRGCVLSFDGASRYLRVDQTDEMQPTLHAMSSSRTLRPLPQALATRFTRIAMSIVASRGEDPYFAAFGRQLRAALADQYTTISLQ